MRPARPNDFSSPRELRRPRRGEVTFLSALSPITFFLFSSPLSSFCRLWKFSYYPLAHDVKETQKKNEKMCLHTQQVFSFSARSGLGTITRPEPFVGHVLTFLNPLLVVLGQWMETIDREICAVLELKRVSDRRRLVDGENGVHPPAVRKR